MCFFAQSFFSRHARQHWLAKTSHRIPQRKLQVEPAIASVTVASSQRGHPEKQKWVLPLNPRSVSPIPRLDRSAPEPVAMLAFPM